MSIRFLSTVVALAAVAGTASAATSYGVTDAASMQVLFRFDTAAPASVFNVGTVTGLGAGETIRGIDFRQANGRLYAVTSGSNASTAYLYGIDLSTGAATAIGSGFTLADNTSTRLSIDFNPVVDRLRIVTSNGESYRVDPNNGTLAAKDTSLDPRYSISAVAYTNNVAGATSTTLYGYDYFGDTLGTIGGLNGVPSPNAGGYTAIGSSGVTTFNAAAGMDIGADGSAYFLADDAFSADNRSEFFRLDLATGRATLVGTLPVAAIDFSLMTTVTAPVPEPGTWALMLAGGGFLAWRSRRLARHVEPQAV